MFFLGGGLLVVVVVVFFFFFFLGKKKGIRVWKSNLNPVIRQKVHVPSPF